MEDSEENSLDNLFSQSNDEDKYELVYGQKSEEASENNSKNLFTFGSTDQSKMFSNPEKYSNIHFFCRNSLCIPILVFKSVLNIISTCKCNQNFLMDIIKYFDKTLNINKESEEKDIEETKEKEKEKENNILLDIFYCQKHKGQIFFVIAKNLILLYVKHVLQKKKNIKIIK